MDQIRPSNLPSPLFSYDDDRARSGSHVQVFPVLFLLVLRPRAFRQVSALFVSVFLGPNPIPMVSTHPDSSPPRLRPNFRILLQRHSPPVLLGVYLCSLVDFFSPLYAGSLRFPLFLLLPYACSAPRLVCQVPVFLFWPPRGDFSESAVSLKNTMTPACCATFRRWFLFADPGNFLCSLIFGACVAEPATAERLFLLG